MDRFLRVCRRTIGGASAALAILVAGLTMVETVWKLLLPANDQIPVGIYFGKTRGSISVLPSEGLTFQSLVFEGETVPCWQRENSPFKYSELALVWGEVEPTALGGRVRLFLPSLRFENSMTNGVLTSEGLALWLANHDTRATTNSHAAKAMDEAFQLFRSAADGSLPPPRHHGYSLGQRGLSSGRLYHFRLGFGLGVVGWLWLLAWPIVCWFVLRKLFRRIDRPDGGEPPSPLTPHLS